MATTYNICAKQCQEFLTSTGADLIGTKGAWWFTPIRFSNYALLGGLLSGGQPMTEDELIGNLKKLSRRFLGPRVRQSFVREIAMPATEEQLGQSEKQLGFGIPPLLRRIYTEVGNGGFGPGYGLIGCLGGYRDDRGDTIVEAYLGRSRRDPEDPEWRWPEKLVPLFSWGGACYTCGDFNLECSPLLEFYPHQYKRGSSLSAAFRPHGEALQEFLARWISGEEVMLL